MGAPIACLLPRSSCGALVPPMLRLSLSRAASGGSGTCSERSSVSAEVSELSCCCIRRPSSAAAGAPMGGIPPGSAGGAAPGGQLIALTPPPPTPPPTEVAIAAASGAQYAGLGWCGKYPYGCGGGNPAAIGHGVPPGNKDESNAIIGRAAVGALPKYCATDGCSIVPGGGG